MILVALVLAWMGLGDAECVPYDASRPWRIGGDEARGSETGPWVLYSDDSLTGTGYPGKRPFNWPWRESSDDISTPAPVRPASYIDGRTASRPRENGRAAQGRVLDRSRLATALLLIPPVYVQTMFFHELSHAVVAKIGGAEITLFKPYPHVNRSLGRFVNGAVGYRGLRSDFDQRWVHLAPYIWEASTVAIIDRRLRREKVLCRRSVVDTWLYVTGAMSIVDFALNWSNLREQSDISKVSRKSGVPRVLFLIVGDVVAGIAFYRFVQLGRRLFYGQTTPPSTALGIYVHPKLVGVWYRF